MTHPDEILTPRLRLRRWLPSDERAMAGINRDPDVARHLNRPVDSEAIAAFYALVSEHWRAHGFGYWALEARDADIAERFIGFAGVSYPTFLPELASRPEIGWRLARAAWGRGLATEAALAARDDAFARELPELIAIIHPDNARSQRVAAKLEMSLLRHVHNPVLGREVEVWQVNAPKANEGPSTVNAQSPPTGRRDASWSPGGEN